MVAANVSGRAWLSIEGEPSSVSCWEVELLDELPAVLLAWWSEQWVSDGAEAAAFGAYGVHVDEADGAKSPKGSSAGVLAVTKVGGKRAR